MVIQITGFGDNCGYDPIPNHQIAEIVNRIQLTRFSFDHAIDVGELFSQATLDSNAQSGFFKGFDFDTG
ncbi:hypothetical protein ASD94_17490 [Acidovorax sp. Root70]|nr:hypothetical protein ASD94_17490 [Acidovorax sp. Root70]